MNITPHTTSLNLPLATVVNPATEGLRRENHQKEIITQVVATNPSAAEKGVASDKDRARTPNQANEEYDFVTLKKQAEQAVTSISGQKEQQGNDSQSDTEKQENTSRKTPENESNDDNAQQEQADAKVINELKQRDREVRTHELAHASTGGSLTGPPSYTFQVGPDGNKYAVGGEVSVDLTPVAGDPQATIVKMKKVHAAALAPANPSSQDIKVAAGATQQILAAQSELLTINNPESNELNSPNIDQSRNTDSTLNSAEHYEQNESNAFDAFINKTLSAQDTVTANNTSSSITDSLHTENARSTDVVQRASRIEDFYFTISQGYERPDNFQFELTA